MNHRQRQLLETLAGHFAWLKTAHPRKASKPLVRRAERAVLLSLREAKAPTRKAA